MADRLGSDLPVACSMGRGVDRLLPDHPAAVPDPERLGCSAFTAALWVGILVAYSRPLWKRLSFWLAIAGALAVQLPFVKALPQQWDASK
jgi:hypothetical protein